MIKAYLAAVPALYEGEDIAVTYCIYEEEVCVRKETLSLPYVKPTLSGQAAVLALLQGLQRYKQQELTISINDASLYQLLLGNSTTKNPEVLRMAAQVRRQLEKYAQLTFVNATQEKQAFLEWKKRLED